MKQRKSDGSTPAVVNCYSVFDKWFPCCEMLDYTEGMYHGDPDTPYDQAQHNQINYVLDEVGCGRGTRVLDIGCGNGTLLDEVQRRGATGIGVTISPEQVKLCNSRGLDVRLLNYRDIGDDWTARFDAVVANGPLEHFVQPADAVRNRADPIYREFFEICHRVIDPSSSVKRLINTTIHYVRRPDPEDLLKTPSAFAKDSDSFHYALLARSFGGWYPVSGQLERCARRYFDLHKTDDGTHDYHLTSEAWLRRVRSKLKTTTAARIFFGSLPVLARHPKQFFTMIRCMLISESWNWQFRPPDPPTKLLRQTWEYC